MGDMLIVANWKAYVDSKEKAKALVTASRKITKHDVVLCVPTAFLGHLSAKGTQVLGAQDISATTGGATTGEVTGNMLLEAGASYVIVGHSERRARGETNEVVFEKVQRALAHKLTPIVCVGETERDEEATYLNIVRAQLAAVFAPLSQKERLAIVIAYEPVWAIGKTAAESIEPHDLREMILYIRKVLGEYLPGKSAEKVKILYGGSTEAANARDLAAAGNVDGFLIGHASVDAAQFQAIAKAVS